jgi:hypothetical protein
MAYVLYARYRLRLLAGSDGFVISEGEIAAQLDGAKDLFKGDFELICTLIQSASQVYCDETGWRIGGRHYWIWVCTLRPKVCCTRWRLPGPGMLPRTYWAIRKTGCSSPTSTGSTLTCWVHLLRDSERVGGQFHKELKAVFGSLKDELAKPVADRNYADVDQLLQAIADKTYTGQYLVRVGQLQNRIKRTKAQLLTCLKDEGILPENNTAERALRNHVVMCKISGGSRSKAGAEKHWK